ncbi:CocE/NonD family hydrolase [Bdellovibrio sp. SKB1291214]|uniref:CocE/NonD family hydrolase n=1 Tax=Bdellovibrio sp. SKB1291214 TaxID=1732569 RepID=UPI000B51AB4E|nr:CocE/NonD family hydrolase [Bdellovibrio sp. SKB1291214]UYL09486.1 CocE/NonD family hydrolase [Bdellovibrio sp. SKB1291214]
MNFKIRVSSLLLLALTALGSLSAMAYPSTPVEKICDQYPKRSKLLGEAEFEMIQKELINYPADWLQEFCLGNPELVLNNGVMTIYRHGQKNAIILINRDRNVADIAFAEISFDYSIAQAAVTMSDGIQIPTLVFKPSLKKATTVPALLVRSPYFSKGISFTNYLAAVKNGIAVVLQPARGTSNAPGDFEWLNWKQEAKDANATMNWITQQKWFNGDIYAAGVSYDGFLALAAATTNHPALQAALPTSAPWNPSADSLSAHGNGVLAMKYTTGLNWDGNTRPAAIDKLARTSKNYDELLENARRTFGVHLRSLTQKQLAKKSEDFLAALKKTKATMIYSYGFRDDQDSRDVINLAKHMQGLKNHYFVTHGYGHSGFISLSMLTNMHTEGKASASEISKSVSTFFKSKSACLVSTDNQGLFVKNCSDDVNTIWKVGRVVVTLDQPLHSEKGIINPMWSNPAKANVLGQRKIKLKITAPAKDLTIAIDTVSVQDGKMEFDTQASGSEIIHLKKGTNNYEITSQHEFFEFQPTAYGLYIRNINYLTGEILENSILTLESVSYDLPLY